MDSSLHGTTPLRQRMIIESPWRLSLPDRTGGMPQFPPSRLVRRLPARRQHVRTRQRVRAGTAQPLTIVRSPATTTTGNLRRAPHFHAGSQLPMLSKAAP